MSWSKFGWITFGVAILLILSGSPAHSYETDPLFWFLLVAALGLVVLSAELNGDSDPESRKGCIRVFFLVMWAITMLMAAGVAWTHR